MWENYVFASVFLLGRGAQVEIRLRFCRISVFYDYCPGNHVWNLGFGILLYESLWICETFIMK